MATIVHAEEGNGVDRLPVASVFDDLVRVETRLYNALNERLRVACGITTSQYELLDHLARRPGSRVADLAGYFAVGLGATSKGIDRLAAAGWVQREPNPEDGRSSLLRLTTEGTALVAGARTVFHDALERLTRPVDDTEGLSRVAAVLHDLRQALEFERIGTPTG